MFDVKGSILIKEIAIDEEILIIEFKGSYI